jgi:thiosulfate/3-mercaptopyruvate sulfurtransferase
MSLCTACLLLASLTHAADAKKPVDYPRSDLLVEAKELASPKVAKTCRILDTRSQEKYRAGHIPGAASVSPAAWSAAFNAGEDSTAWGRRLGAVGLDPETCVVVYGDDYREAARIWWILRYWGFRDVRLLNGGWLAWKNQGGKVVQDEPKLPAREVKLASQASRLADRGQVLDSLTARREQIIDVRSTAEHCGETATAKRNGSMPGALHLEWSAVIDARTQRFRNAEELSKLLHAAGIDPAKPALTYCQSGGRAAVMAFALELMGGKEVRNYYRSWAEWGNADDTPIVKPAPKKPQR